MWLKKSIIITISSDIKITAKNEIKMNHAIQPKQQTDQIFLYNKCYIYTYLFIN